MTKSVSVSFSARMLEDLALAESLIGVSNGFGHGPGAHCGKGERIAGFYYLNETAKRQNVLPAHCVGAMRDLIREISDLLRDSGSDPQGENSRSEVECAASQSGGTEGDASPTPQIHNPEHPHG